MYKMEYEENSANLATLVARKKLINIDSGTKSLKQFNKTLMLKNVSEYQGDIICNVEVDLDRADNEHQNAIVTLDDTNALKLDDTMNKILEILDETINIFKIVDIGSKVSLPLDYDSDDNGYEYQLMNKDVHVTENLNNDSTLTENHQNESHADIGAEINSVDITVTKNKNKKWNEWNEWNEFIEAFMIAFMLFNVYYLLSCII